MRIAYWITKAKNTHSEYVILLFHCNSGCMNAPRCYVICSLFILFRYNTGQGHHPKICLTETRNSGTICYRINNSKHLFRRRCYVLLEGTTCVSPRNVTFYNSHYSPNLFQSSKLAIQKPAEMSTTEVRWLFISRIIQQLRRLILMK